MAESSEQSKALMIRITEEIWNQGHLELVDELIAEDLVDHVDLPGLPDTGRERYRASVEGTRAAFSDFANPLDVVVAENDLAVSYGRIVGTNDGEWMGMPATGKRLDVAVWGMLRFRGGQAVERWGLFDTMTMAQQLGLLG